jgi:hypothetical protein
VLSGFERVLGRFQERVSALPPYLLVSIVLVAMLTCALTYDNVHDLVHERHLQIQTESFQQRQTCGGACREAIIRFQSN